ncbi:hypothetical protein [Pseudanabaena sp. PCC 6802]|uniref:hypothetical protein n=1 Tax=Pseudanabaena sp. PCC 6802 TaxID=118173 RepID=UPI00034A7EDB|nr:hypothetical protein [Pseudanabaena sp. PCC 6802]
MLSLPANDRAVASLRLVNHCPLPWMDYTDDFDIPEVPYRVVVRDIPEYGYAQAVSLEEHYRVLFRLGYANDEEEDNG